MLLKSLKNTGFTLVEIMITVVLIGVIAAFAIPNYSKMTAKAHERDAINQLSILHAACQLYKASNGNYFPTNLTTTETINSNFNINIISADGTSYQYYGGATFYAIAAYGGWEIKITNIPISPSALNPCCTLGTCPSLPNC